MKGLRTTKQPGQTAFLPKYSNTAAIISYIDSTASSPVPGPRAAYHSSGKTLILWQSTSATVIKRCVVTVMESLLSVAGKVLAHVMLRRLLTHVVDMIFVARLLQEKCREQHQSLFLAFIDLTKAFDTVNRDLLWTVMGSS